jgi:hypothetical protein
MTNNTQSVLKYRGIAYKSESITLKYLLKKELEKKVDQSKMSAQEIF